MIGTAIVALFVGGGGAPGLWLLGVPVAVVIATLVEALSSGEPDQEEEAES
jgi:predicted PurR-regulated permease PerM